jgi:hypothetical protein
MAVPVKLPITFLGYPSRIILIATSHKKQEEYIFNAFSAMQGKPDPRYMTSQLYQERLKGL